MADALENIAAAFALGTKEDITIPACSKQVVTPSEEEFKQEINVVFVYEVQKEDWSQPLIDIFVSGSYQIMSGLRRKSKGEDHAFFTTITIYIDAPSLACG